MVVRASATSAENGATAGQDAGESGNCEFSGAFFKNAIPCIKKPDNRIAVIIDCFACHRTNNGIKTRTVSASG